MPMPGTPGKLSLPATGAPPPDELTTAALAGRMKAAAPVSLAAPVAIIADFKPPFFLYHHPDSWDLSSTHGDGNERLKGPTLLPQVQAFIISPGAFGCRTRRRGEDFSTVYSAAVKRWQETKGVTFLDPEVPIPAWALPPGVPEGGYLRELEVRHPLTDQAGSRWSEAWHIPAPTRPGNPQHFTHAQREYELWLAWLVQSGQLQPASERAYELARKKWQNRVDGIMGLAVSSEVREAMLQRRKPWLDAATNAQPIEDMPSVAEVAA